jgi:tetratricopeptide (TPR) repeat protein
MTEQKVVSGTIDELLAHARQLFNSGNVADADSLCEQIIIRTPSRSEPWFIRAAAAAQGKDLGQAVRFLDAADRIDPPDPQRFKLRLLLYQHLGRFADILRLAFEHRAATSSGPLADIVAEARSAHAELAAAARRRRADGRYDLGDVTFIIPVYIESDDRARNLEIILAFLARHFDTNVLVCEDVKNRPPRAPEGVDRLAYRRLVVTGNDTPYFHKTWMINHAVENVRTPFVVAHDSDAVIAPVQYAAARARAGRAVVFPYNGTVVDIPRSASDAFAGHLDPAEVDLIAAENLYPGLAANGGAVLFERETLRRAGGFNERIVAWGLEDREIIERLAKLGHVAERLGGPLVHLRHVRTTNSNETHPFWRANVAELEAMRALAPADLAAAATAGRFRRPLINRHSAAHAMDMAQRATD